MSLATFQVPSSHMCLVAVVQDIGRLRSDTWSWGFKKTFPDDYNVWEPLDKNEERLEEEISI